MYMNILYLIQGNIALNMMFLNSVTIALIFFIVTTLSLCVLLIILRKKYKVPTATIINAFLISIIVILFITLGIIVFQFNPNPIEPVKPIKPIK